MSVSSSRAWKNGNSQPHWGRKRMTRVWVIVRVLLIIRAATSAVAARADILVGVGAPLTGPSAWSGEQIQHGVEFATAELNAAGGLLGQRVALTFADDYCDPEQAVVAARKLVAQRIVAVLADSCSGAAIPASEVYEEAQIPFVALPTNPRLTER